ncbi:putative benzoate 4-monooxygenase cytochrome P450 [Hypoxylon crocopeplum]|nr:putative benzoate 4-monooxygenase cytochrome P450 [Hypoxylon crocopeplum]
MPSLHSILPGSSSLSLEGLASQAVVPGALIGIIFHLAIARRLKVEDFMYQLIAVIPFAIFGIASIYSLVGFPLFDVFTRTCIVASSFNAGLFSSMTIYRLFFHRLRNFPGPIDVKVSRLFSAFRAANSGKYYNEIGQMHEEYGDFVRTGPRELSIRRKSVVSSIFGPNSKCLKSTWYMQQDVDSRRSSLHLATDRDDHRRRRRAWDRGLSIKALNAYEPRIKVLVDSLVSQISQQTVNVTAWTMFLTFDSVGEVGFGKSFGCVSSGIEHSAIKGIHDHMAVLGVMGLVPWLLNLLTRIPGATAGYAPMFSYCASRVEENRKTFDPEEYPTDVMSWLLKAVVEKDISASPTEKSLEEDARALLVAGSDTSASTLASALFYLAKFPLVLKKLQAQIDIAMPSPADWTYEKMKSITYLDNIIDEVLRLKPALQTGGYRETPAQGIEIDGQYIPGYTNVFVPQKVIHLDERYWKQAKEFIPERFGERSIEMETDGAPYMPFGSGAFSCPGKNLAMMMMRIAISRIAQHFDILFAPGETGEEFDNGAIDAFTTILPPLMLEFQLRKR